MRQWRTIALFPTAPLPPLKGGMLRDITEIKKKSGNCSTFRGSRFSERGLFQKVRNIQLFVVVARKRIKAKVFNRNSVVNTTDEVSDCSFIFFSIRNLIYDWDPDKNIFSFIRQKSYVFHDNFVGFAGKSLMLLWVEDLYIGNEEIHDI